MEWSENVILNLMFGFLLNLLLCNCLWALHPVRSLAIVCLSQNVNDFLSKYDPVALEQFNLSPIYVFCESLEGEVSSDVNIYKIGDFQQTLESFKYIFVVQPDFFVVQNLLMFSQKTLLCGRGLNVIYCGDELSNIDGTSLGNIYLGQGMRLAQVRDFSMLHSLIYNTVYDFSVLTEYLRDKDTPTLYLLEVILQSCIFYNQIGVDSVRGVKKIPYLLEF